MEGMEDGWGRRMADWDGGWMGEDCGLAFGHSVLFPCRTCPVYDT